MASSHAGQASLFLCSVGEQHPLAEEGAGGAAGIKCVLRLRKGLRRPQEPLPGKRGVRSSRRKGGLSGEAAPAWEAPSLSLRPCRSLLLLHRPPRSFQLSCPQVLRLGESPGGACLGGKGREKGSCGQREVGSRSQMEDQCAFSEHVAFSPNQFFGRMDLFEKGKRARV